MPKDFEVFEVIVDGGDDGTMFCSVSCAEEHVASMYGVPDSAWEDRVRVNECKLDYKISDEVCDCCGVYLDPKASNL